MVVADFEGFVQDLKARASLVVLSSYMGLQEWTQEQEEATYMKS